MRKKSLNIIVKSSSLLLLVAVIVHFTGCETTDKSKITKQTLSQPIEKAAMEPTKPPIKQPQEKAIKEPAKQTLKQPQGKITKETTEKATEHATAIETLEKRWGIEFKGIRLTANGFVVDFRYKITDPDKAMPILDNKVKPLLIDQASGAKLSVPSSPKVGSLRPTSRHGAPKVGRQYYVLFSNLNYAVKRGSKVTIEIGEFKVKDLVVK